MNTRIKVIAIFLQMSILLLWAGERQVDGQRRISHRQSHCPPSCICFMSTVRCMHLNLVAIPRVSPDTRILDLRFNNMREISSTAFRGMRHLNSLLLNNNDIQSIQADAFHGLTSLKYLYIFRNKIKHIHNRAFQGMHALEQLYLHENDIAALQPNTFSNLPNLERLLLHNNEIVTLPNKLFNSLSSLKRLRLDGNKLECDCRLEWFAKWLQDEDNSNLQAAATCYSPRQLAGRGLANIHKKDLTCEIDEQKTPPVIVSQPVDVEVDQGHTVRIDCRVRGNPKPEIRWEHDRVQVVESHRVQITSSGTLFIQTSRKTDRGVYRCIAENSEGRVESRFARLYFTGLARPPTLTIKPRDEEAMINDRVTFNCRAEGDPRPVIRWYRNNDKLSLTRNYVIMPETLHIVSASLQDNATFMCLASNSVGNVNSTAVLLIRSPPVLTVTPTSQTVTQGDSVTFECNAEGIPEPKITWHKDGRPLNRDQRYLVMPSGSLLIRAINTEDEGTYTCTANNQAGSSLHDARLTVIIPPHFLVRPQNQRVRQGVTVNFQCQIAGRPQPQIVWTVNDRAVPDDPRFSLLPSGTLRLLRADLTDVGIYRCEAANSVGVKQAQVTLNVIRRTPLEFLRTPADQNVESGEDVQIPCYVSGGSGDNIDTEIFWTKDGVRIVPYSERYHVTSAPSSVLFINRVSRDDSGRYSCTARSGSDVISASMNLVVNNRNSMEEIVEKLSDILPPNCLRDGCNELMLDDTDEGLDELIQAFISAEPNHRSKRQSGSIVSISDIQATVRNAQFEVNRGINGTIAQLNNRNNRPFDLFTLMRFPSTQEGLDLMRAAEVFDVSLRMIECCVRRGMKLKRFSVRSHEFEKTTTQNPNTRANQDTVRGDDLDSDVPFVGSEVVELVANLSGCSAHRPPPDCSANICFHRKYRTSDGTCNNLHHPMWGASLTPFHRILQPIYENGFNAPITWNPRKEYNNHTLPSARSVSVAVLMSAGSRPPREDPIFTHMVMQWGQFVDHDITFTTMAPSVQRFSDGLSCRDTCEREAPCFPIGVDNTDPRHGRFNHHSESGSRRNGHRNHHNSPSCMEFTRSSAVCGSGITSVFFSAISRREQINQITSYMDGSNVYGSTDTDTRNLRDRTSDLGLLKEGQSLEVGYKPLLPYNVFSDLDSGSNTIRPVAPIECRRGNSETAQQRSVPCFLAGDLRANEHVSLTTMHTMWMREHNRIARYLKKANGHWDGDTVFHEARKIVGAEMQHITYSHWLPKLLGPFMDTIGPYKSYDPNTPSSIVNVFATAAFRFGHTMINPIMYRLNESYHESSPGNLMLHEAFFAPFRIVHEGGIDPLIRGLIAKPMKARDSDSNMNSELIERLFSMAEEIALDLGALNIQRGRDHALPFYGDWRSFCNLTQANTFKDLSGEIKNQEVRRKLEELYGTPANIDPFVGMIVEDTVPGSRLGPTLGCLLGEQFKRIRDGDRFWYENPGIFSPAQVTAIKQASIARLICDNTDTIKNVPRDVFLNQPTSEFVSCEEIPSIDLTAWVDCCQDCVDSGRFETLSGHIRQQRRSKRNVDKTFDISATIEQDRNDTSVLRFEKPQKTHNKEEYKSDNEIEPPKRKFKTDATSLEEQTLTKLLSVVARLEEKVNQLQGEVSQLETKLANDDKH